ncbi:DUF2169 family type VI secretion system accessory protein [Bordetella genomosp. 4]|uniref:DUF2169 domain-containing protein n=1 Tax=Bordetella genomosp. 4 TaxID=463044 RepID=A0A261UC07_9BORD|nr:DUF2169 domain-containing protein [Bordetella genomosp. 4]OZI59131.1 hypothetical protein CAL20_05740 [Bordetella genomosp. 4]
MKIIKPVRLTVMPRPYRWRGQVGLSVAVAALVHHGSEGARIQAEHTLVNDVLPELDADEVLDFVMPKPHPEYMVSGSAYTVHQEDKTRCVVSVRVGDKRKDGLVFGNRYWMGDRITEPQPFEAMPLTWSNSFGGSTFPENPLGTGLDAVEVNGIEAIRLPNLESPVERIHTRGQRVEPYNFGQIRVDWPQRLEKFGSCDEKWVNTIGAGFFDDLQLSAFNAAPDDQVWQDRDALFMDEDFEFWNMHPELHCWSGRLLDVRARCFIKRQDADDLDEVPLRPTTVWFLPNRTSYVLIFHGQIPIADDDAMDVQAIMAAMEHQAQERSMDHYRHIYARRTNFDTAALDTLRDADLMPADILAPWLEDVPLGKQALVSKLTDRLRRDTGAYPSGGFIGPVKPVTLADLTEMAEQYQVSHDEIMASHQKERQKAFEEMHRSVESSGSKEDAALLSAIAEATSPKDGGITLPQVGPPDLDAVFQTVRSSDSRQSLRKAFSGKEAAGSTPREVYDHSKRALKQIYLYSVHYQQGVARVGPHRAQQIREQVEKKYRLSKNLSDMDLTGADLSGMNLSGADFSRTWLEKVDFTNTDLTGAKFEETVLARGSFTDCRLDGAVFTRANISDAVFTNTSFGSATLDKVICELPVRFDHCTFESGKMTRFRMQRSEFRDCVMRDMELSDVSFEHALFSNVDIADTHFDKISFEQSSIDDLRIEASVINGCVMLESTFHRWHMQGSLMSKCAFMTDIKFSECRLGGNHFQQTTFRAVDFSRVSFQGATLDQCDFSQANLYGCDMRKIQTPQSVFVRTCFDMADLSGSNLMQGNFQKATFVGANLSGCNLFRADMSETLLDASTRIENPYVRRTRLAPYRQGQHARLGGGAV